MGNRSYLYLKNQKRAVYLFEANNSLPFFWISLLDKETLKNKLPDWEKSNLFEEFHNAEEYLAQQLNEISINEKTFLANSAKSKAFLQNHLPRTVPLYDDFIKFIKSKFELDDYLEFDITEFSAFYNSLDDFYNAIDNDLEAIETNNPSKIKFLFVEDLISSGTGFEMLGRKDFALLPSYQEALKSRTLPKIIDKQKFSKKALIKYIIMLIICPVFSFVAYIMYMKEGLTFQTVLILILNVVFYCFSIFGILAELKTYKAQKN